MEILVRYLELSDFVHIYGPTSFYTRKIPGVSYKIWVRGKVVFLITGTLLYTDFYDTFNSSICGQIEAGSRLMQQVG